MPKRPRETPPTASGYALTVNQVVSYNLARARRSRGWTQEETAERLEAASGKKWTAATLSASERAIKTGRPRVFDANELIAFSRVFEYPVGFFLLPIEQQGPEEAHFYYRLSRHGEDDGRQTEPLLETMDLLRTVVPLRYPAAMVDAINRLLQPQGVVWQPYASVEWDDGGQSDYDTWRYLNDQGETPEVTLDEWKTITEFAALSKRVPPGRLLRLVADAMDQGAAAEGSPPDAAAPF